MWIVKWILIVVAVILIIGFAMQNADVSVPIKFYKWETINDLPLWLVMYLSFIVGMIFWLGVSIYQVITLKSESRKWQKKVKSLESELNRLRNVSVEDSVVPDEPASQQPTQAS
jgi:uncharacterized integral membrane protein